MDSVGAAWDRTAAYFADGTFFAADFNTWLLRELSPRWAGKVRVSSSHSRLLVMAPAAQPYRCSEHVYVEYQGPERVEMALERNVPRKSPTRTQTR